MPAVVSIMSCSIIQSPAHGRRLGVRPHGISIMIELGPLEERAFFLARDISSVAHPEILPIVLLLPLDNLQHTRHAACALGRESRMHVRSVMTVRDVYSFVSRNRVRVYGKGRRHRVFPFLLHLGVHHQQRIMRQMDRDLPLCIRVFY